MLSKIDEILTRIVQSKQIGSNLIDLFNCPNERK